MATEYRQQTAWELSSRPIPNEDEKRTEVTHFEAVFQGWLATVAACVDSARMRVGVALGRSESSAVRSLQAKLPT